MAEAAEQFDDEEVPGNVPSPTPGKEKPDWYYNEHPKGGGEDSSDDLRDKEVSGGSKPRHLHAVPDGERSFLSTSGSGSQGAGQFSLGGWLRRRKRRATLAVSLFVATMVAAVVIFIALLPFKILHIVNNLQSRFYSTSENAVQ